MRILYHHRTAAEDGQAVHIRSMLRAFRATGHQVEEVALVRRGDGTVAAGDPGAPEARRAAPGSPTAASASARSESGDR